MAYRYHSRRSTRRLARKTKRNLIITFILLALLIYATIQWVLPTLINSLGFINSIIKPSKKIEAPQNPSSAPPVLNIPYEATNTAQINIRGYGTPGSKVTIYLDDERVDTIDVSSDGTFEAKNIDLVLGTNNIYGKSIDEKNLESLPSRLIKVIYDNEKPTLEIYEPEDGKEIQGERRIKISGKTEPQAQIAVNENRVVVHSDGIFSTDYQLNDGENIFNIKAQDLAGNLTEISKRVVFKP